MSVIANNRYTDLPVPKYDASEDFDVLKKTDKFLDEICIPFTPGQPVTFNVARDDLVQSIIHANSDNVDMTAETACRAIFNDTITSLSNVDAPARLCYVHEAAIKAKLPIADKMNAVYGVASDIQPAARAMLSTTPDPGLLLPSFGYTFEPPYVGTYFVNKQAFLDFKAWLKGQAALLKQAGAIDSDAIQQFNDFDTNQKLDDMLDVLKLDEALPANSFSALFSSLLYTYMASADPKIAGLLPFDLGQVICPTIIGFINIEEVAKATSNQIHKAFEDANSFALNMKGVKLLSKKKLLSMQTMASARKKFAAMARQTSNSRGSARRAMPKFSGKVSGPSIAKYIKKTMAHMGNVQNSKNSVQTSQMSFNRSNRRKPLDGNLPGKSRAIKYYPDIHIYLDTSGSISEENYESAIKTCIDLSQKLNVNMYFNSFSDYISPETMLHTKDRSKAAVYDEFKHTPKVTGGTDFANVWEYIMTSNKRKKQLSIMITDFGYSAPNHSVRYPKNLYYAPVVGFGDGIKDTAEYFAQSMRYIAPNIVDHIFMSHT